MRESLAHVDPKAVCDVDVMKEHPENLITGSNVMPPDRIHHRRIGVRLMLK
jgi:hypothetical protein